MSYCVSRFSGPGHIGAANCGRGKTRKNVGSDFYVRAKVHTLGGFSAHAGQSQLLEWAANFKQPTRFYLVHGEAEALQVLQQKLLDKLGISAEVPAEGTSIVF